MPRTSPPDGDVRSRLAGQCEGHGCIACISNVDHARRQQRLQATRTKYMLRQLNPAVLTNQTAGSRPLSPCYCTHLHASCRRTWAERVECSKRLGVIEMSIACGREDGFHLQGHPPHRHVVCRKLAAYWLVATAAAPQPHKRR